MLFSPHFKRNVYHVMGVQGRDKTGQMANVEIHPGNVCGDVDMGYTSDVEGCILLGNAFGKKLGQKAVLDSQSAVKRFEDALEGQPFLLEVS